MEFSSRDSFIQNKIEQEMMAAAAAAIEAARQAAIDRGEIDPNDDYDDDDDGTNVDDVQSVNKDTVPRRLLGADLSMSASSSPRGSAKRKGGGKGVAGKRAGSKVAAAATTARQLDGAKVKQPGAAAHAASDRTDSTSSRDAPSGDDTGEADQLPRHARIKLPDIVLHARTRNEYEHSPVRVPFGRHHKRLAPLQPYHQRHRHLHLKPPLDDHNELYSMLKRDAVSKPKIPHFRQLITRENHWVRATHLSAYDPVYPVVVGIPPSQPKGYFRAFSEMISIPLEEPRLAQLLPHRFRRTIRLYGISPMVLLAKPKRRLEPLGMPLGFPRLPSLTSDKPLGSIPTNTDDGKRVAGAEIEPRLGDDGEFGPLNFDESDLTTNGTAADLESNADSALHPVLEDRTTMAMSPTQSAPEPSDTQAADVAPPDIADSNPSQIDAPPKREPARPQRRDSDRAVPKPQPPKVERVQRKSSKQFETAPKATKTRKQTIIDSPPPLPVDDSPPLEDTQRHPSPPEKLPPPQPEVHVTVVTPPQPLSRSISPPSKSTSHLSKDDRPAILQVKKPTAIPVVAHRRQPTQEEQKAEFEKQQNVLMAKKLERPNKAMQSGGNLINKSGSDATDQSKLQSIMAGEPLATSKGFLTSIMQNMRVMDEETKGRLTIISAPIFKEKPMVGMMEMENALKSMNASRKLSDQEIEYIKRVFELVNDDTVDKDEFLVIAALAERMTLLDQKVRLSFYDTDFKKLEKNIKEYRQLYTVYTADDGKMSYEDLNVLLQATGKSQEELGEISQMLNIKDVNPHSAVGFLDFLSYVPFFTKLHENIVNNPFGDTSSSLGDVAHALGTDTGLGGGGGRN